MKEKTVLYGIMFALGLGIITGWSPMARAITPTGPGLEDRNGVYMGQLLSVHHSASDQTISYTTYLPAVNGILQFDTSTSNGSPLFTNTPVEILHNQPDCAGGSFIYNDDSSAQWIHPWIVSNQSGNLFFKVSSSTISVNIDSIEQAGGACTNLGAPINYSVRRLNPITLPFDPNAVVLPYKITP